MDYLDLYCERTGPGLWAEPINAVTNAAMFAAAALLWRDLRQAGALAGWKSALLLLVLAIATGSTLFHTFATPWARVLDELPILLFQLLFLWCYTRRVMTLGRMAAATGLLAYLAAALYARQFPQLLNGSLVYAPALAAMGALGFYHARSSQPLPLHLAHAALILAVAVVLRTFDASVCEHFALGTHFLWHLLVAVVAYLALRALFAADARPAGVAAVRQARARASNASTR